MAKLSPLRFLSSRKRENKKLILEIFSFEFTSLYSESRIHVHKKKNLIWIFSFLKEFFFVFFFKAAPVKY